MKDILNEIINTKIKKITYENVLKLNSMSEYEFNVIKTKTLLENKTENEMYFKIVKNSRIKESIFCYWSLIYEEELSKKSLEKKEELFLSKVIISELTRKNFYQSVFLKIENNKLDIIPKGTEVDFIDVNRFIIENGKIQKYKEILECFNGLEEYVLLVGSVEKT